MSLKTGATFRAFGGRRGALIVAGLAAPGNTIVIRTAINEILQRTFDILMQYTYSAGLKSQFPQ
jgi:hypothetical protein